MSPTKRIQPLFQMDGKIALVTGASKGIGEAMARGLAEFGASVVVSSRKQEAVDKVASAFQADGLEATGIAANMSNGDDIQLLVENTVETYGGIDIVINNAAANPVFGPIQETDERAFNKIIDVNLKGPFELCKAAYPILKKSWRWFNNKYQLNWRHQTRRIYWYIQRQQGCHNQPDPGHGPGLGRGQYSGKFYLSRADQDKVQRGSVE